jgi:hypothetical protein
MLDRLVMGSGPFGPDAPRPYMIRPFVPQSFPHGSPAALLSARWPPGFDVLCLQAPKRRSLSEHASRMLRSINC